jgi:hypothetical protein
MEVSWILAGVLQRVPEGAQLRMGLYRLRRDGERVVGEEVRAVEAVLEQDSLEGFRGVVKRVVGELLWKP